MQQQENRDARFSPSDKPAAHRNDGQRNDESRSEQKRSKNAADREQKGGEKGKTQDGAGELFAWTGAAQGHGPFQGGGDIAANRVHAGQIDVELQAQIDRIAAAIAEQAQRGQQSRFTVQLPGGLPIESAVLARSATGYVSILLVARPGALGLNDRKLIRRELQDRLQKHPIKLAEIGFAGKAG
ncbi:hypothetical protein GCM10009096_23350 [Parasphingorhabdus litoris]|uniref:Flagellar hook-length control protein FliK n=1 Tax=Parasphingorhabdus litoris TaxID=394733 RepID=A0ABN1ANH3_9SPHN